jgi:hypothetical protein
VRFGFDISIKASDLRFGGTGRGDPSRFFGVWFEVDMPTLPPTFRPGGARSRREQNIDADRRRGSARQRGYTGAWDKAAAGYIAEHPVCEYCDLDGYLAVATLVDHLYPQRQFDGVFWERGWWVACCASCHSGMKQAAERAGKGALDDLARRLGRVVL